MPRYRIVLTQLVADDELSDHEDRESLSLGKGGEREYVHDAGDSHMALDWFHDHVAIGSLDDYTVTVDKVRFHYGEE